SARFMMDDELTNRVAALTRLPVDDVREVEVHRSFSGGYLVKFPHAKPVRALDAAEVAETLAAAAEDIQGMSASKTEEPVKDEMLAKLREANALVSDAEVGEQALKDIRRVLRLVDTSKT